MTPERTGRHRRLTRFLCQELLYEYEAGRLTPPRRADVDLFLSDDYESSRELENLRKGDAYAESLAALELTAPLAEALRAFEPRWKIKLQAWTLWSSKRGWRVLPIALTATTAVLFVISSRPWRASPEQTLASLTPTPMHLPVASPADGVAAEATMMQANKDNLEDGDAKIGVGTTGVVAPKVAAGGAGAGGAAAVSAAPAPPRAIASVGAPAATPKSSAEAVGATGLPVPLGTSTNEPALGRAELWRGTISIPNFSENAPLIRAKVLELGGKPAGAVDLGWLRGPGEAYFHLALPESNFAQLKAYLTTFGPVRIARETHARKMPAGQLRIILTVKDNGKDDREPASPAQSP